MLSPRESSNSLPRYFSDWRIFQPLVSLCIRLVVSSWFSCPCFERCSLSWHWPSRCCRCCQGILITRMRVTNFFIFLRIAVDQVVWNEFDSEVYSAVPIACAFSQANVKFICSNPNLQLPFTPTYFSCLYCNCSCYIYIIMNLTFKVFMFFYAN